MSKAAIQAQRQPFNPDVVIEAEAKFKRPDPTKPKRGRKPVREDIYISESLAKIEMMETSMIVEKEMLTQNEREELRNTASTLRSRVNRKLEHRTFMRDLENAKIQFYKLTSILTNEIGTEGRDRVIKKMNCSSQAMNAVQSLNEIESVTAVDSMTAGKK